MKSILISIQPKWCEMIFSGKKTIEVRKTAPKETPFKVYVYETQGATETPWVDEDGHLIWKGRGQVVGEYVCNKAIVLPCETTQPHWLKEKTCLSDDEYMDYLGHKDGKGLYITKTKLYDKPRELCEFTVPCKHNKSKPDESCKGCPYIFKGMTSGKLTCDRALKRAPQNWMYVEEF